MSKTASKYKLHARQFGSLIRRLSLIPLILLFCHTAFAQSDEIMLTSGGFTVVEGNLPGTPPSFQPQAGSSLNGANLNFGEVTAISGFSRRVVIKMPIRISAIKPYKLEIEAGQVTGDGIQLSDIGFGIENIRTQPSSNAKWSNTATNVLLTDNALAANPAMVKVIKGVPQFEATLANIPKVVLTGMPTVGSGNLGEDGNSILIDLKFVIVEQYYTPNSFNFPLMLKIIAIN